jgi:predicted nucleotidyltransferase
MTQQLPSLVDRALRRLIRAFAPEKILLFGSWAKGKEHVGSDVDLLIVADLPGNAVVHSRRARQLAADSFPRIDIVFATPEEVASADTAKSPFLLSILGTGIVVYSRADSP